MTEAINLQQNHNLYALRKQVAKLRELINLALQAHQDFKPLANMYRSRIISMLKTSDFRCNSENLLDYVHEIEDSISRIEVTRSEDTANYFIEHTQRLIYALFLSLKNSENDQIIVRGTPKLGKTKQTLESYKKQIQYYRKQELPLRAELDELEKRARRAEKIELNEIQTRLFAVQQRLNTIERKKTRLQEIIDQYQKDIKTRRSSSI